MRRGAGVRSGMALVAAVAIGFGGCRGEQDDLQVVEPQAPPPSEGMLGVNLRNFHEGDTAWVLRADSASVFRDRKRVETERVTIDFLDGDRHVSTLTADRGVLLQTTDDLEAHGHVKVVADDGAVLQTEVLFWDHQRSRIHTDAPVRITRGDDVITGVGMEADPGLDQVDLKKEVRGSVRSDPGTLFPGAGT